MKNKTNTLHADSPRPLDAEAREAATHARRDFQAAAANLRAYIAHAVRFSHAQPAIYAGETRAADALAVYAAALGTRNAAGAYAAALDACVSVQLDCLSSLPGLTSPAWLAFAADVAGVIRAKWETENAAIQAHVAAARAAAEGERAAPAPDLDAQVAAVFAETRAAAALADARSAAHAARHAYGFAVKDRGLSHPETRAACAAVERAADAVKRAEAAHAEARDAANAADAAAVDRAYASGAQDLPGGGDCWDVIRAEARAEARRAEEAARTGATPAGTPAPALPLPGAPEAAHGPAAAPGPDAPGTPSE